MTPSTRGCSKRSEAMSNIDGASVEASGTPSNMKSKQLRSAPTSSSSRNERGKVAGNQNNKVDKRD